MSNELTNEDIRAITVIGDDFTNYSGDVVMAVATTIYLERTMPKGWEGEAGILMAKTMGMRDVSQRLLPATEAMMHLEQEFGASWLAVALDTYYSELNPVPKHVAHMERVLRNAAASVESIKPQFRKLAWCLTQIGLNSLKARIFPLAA